MDQIRGNDAYRWEVAFSGGIAFKYRPLIRSLFPNEKSGGGSLDSRCHD